MAALFIVLSAVSACSPDEERVPRTVEPPVEDTTAPPEGTVALSTVPETTSGETTGEGALDPTTIEAPEVVLRLEGDGGTRFSGLCDAGGEANVLSGEVPKRFTFADLGGSELMCRIQKQDERSGSLRVILLSGNTTRSVQQTNVPGGTVEVSFAN